MGILSDIENKLKEKASALIPKSGWMSRKLWIFAGIVMALVWLGHSDLMKVLDSVVYLTAIYLVTQTAHDIANDFCQAWVLRSKPASPADGSTTVALSVAPVAAPIKP